MDVYEFFKEYARMFKTYRKGVTITNMYITVEGVLPLSQEVSFKCSTTKDEIDKIIQKKNYIDPQRKPCTYCKDYRIGYWILWNGDMRFCSFLNKPNLSLYHLSFQEAWSKLLDYEDQLDWPIECKTCSVNKLCLKCAASLATESGSIDQVDKQKCQLIKEYYKSKKGE